jgi:hypothetical protein
MSGVGRVLSLKSSDYCNYMMVMKFASNAYNGFMLR